MINIRKMLSDDASEVFALMRVFYDSDAVAGTDISDSVLNADIEAASGENPFLDGYVFIEDDKIVGYGMVSRSFSTETGGIRLEVEDLYILPEYRHRGTGSLFFAFLEWKYTEAVIIRLEVEPENKNAVECYKKNGYSFAPYKIMCKTPNSNSGCNCCGK